MKIQRSAEDYLEAMLMLEQEKGVIRSIDVADRLGVTKPSVSYAVKRLRENGYITMDQTGPLHLTDTGLAIAQRMFERHRVLSSLLMDLGVSREQAMEDACKIEHDLSDESFEALRAHMAKHPPK